MRIFNLLRYSVDLKLYSSTIFALSSGQVKSGVAVVRVSDKSRRFSGPSARDALLCMTRLKKAEHLTPRKLYYTPIKDPVTGDTIDNGLAVWFPGPSSFTGEDSCEFHVHGGYAVITDLLTSLSKIRTFLPAEAGEFAKRAFFNGKLDLTSAEGLADLLNAETSAQRKLALRQASGELKKLYDQWREIIIKCLAHIEAYIDFSEEEQIEDNISDAVNEQVSNLHRQMLKHESDSRSGERLRNGVHVVITGKPNVGKSTLLNFLCQRSAAIVTPIAGTTRDVLEVPLDLSGYPVLLADTAGIRKTEDIVEHEGVQRAKQKLKQADLIIVLMDYPTLRQNMNRAALTATNVALTLGVEDLVDYLRIALKDFLDEFDVCSAESTQADEYNFEILILINKIDLVRLETTAEAECFAEYINTLSKINVFQWNGKSVHICFGSCVEYTGMDNLKNRLTSLVATMCGDSLSPISPVFAQQRHRHLINEAIKSCQTYFDLMNKDHVLAAECLRGILRLIDKLTGRVTSDEILDCIFRDFCIGK